MKMPEFTSDPTRSTRLLMAPKLSSVKPPVGNAPASDVSGLFCSEPTTM